MAGSAAELKKQLWTINERIMYFEYFGFNQAPFSLTPDTLQFVSLENHQACLDMIHYALSTGEGFVKVVGDVGTGKTILCRKLLRQLAESNTQQQKFQTLYIPNPMLSPIGLYRAIALELGINTQEGQMAEVLLERVTAAMLEHARQQTSVVVIIDEAQALPQKTLEALRLLTNVETETHKLVQVILFGQTELDDILNQHHFRQLKQRITFSHYLTPLNLDNTRSYVTHRTIRAGFIGESLFSNPAIKKLFNYSNGVPRLINVLAHKALLSAYGRGGKTVSAKDITQAWRDSQKDLTVIGRSYSGFWFVAFLTLAIVTVSVLWVQLNLGILL